MGFERHQNRGHVSILLTVLTPAPSKVLGTGYAPNEVQGSHLWRSPGLTTLLPAQPPAAEMKTPQKKGLSLRWGRDPSSLRL